MKITVLGATGNAGSRVVYTPLRTRCYLPLFNSNLKITLL